MARQEIDIRTTTEAKPAAVWRLLGDSATWPAWTPIEVFELERPAGADGLGEVRVFTTGRYVIREEIVVREPERRLSYRLLSGLPLRDYRADIDLTPRDGGTEIRWVSQFDPKFPGTGGLVRRGLDKFIAENVSGLAAYASRS
jgi:uncharacterized protein YndB with AHSA1/START domain